MHILNEINRPYIIDSLTAPIPLRYHWIFNAQAMDFMLAEITYLEETKGPTITLVVEGTEVKVPGAWNVLIVDMETDTIDVVPATACTAFEHHAFVFSTNDGKLITAPIRAVNWEADGVCTYPAVNKATALVHAISPGVSHGKTVPRGIVIGPNELHRYISRCTVGDILC
jgi:hypothetical protein